MSQLEAQPVAVAAAAVAGTTGTLDGGAGSQRRQFLRRFMRHKPGVVALLVLTAFYLMYFPGLALLLTVLCVNFLGDAMRDAFDPQSTR
jgi:peptide/nickel transport system permease protein